MIKDRLFAQAFEAVQSAGHILLIADFDPDGDSIGASTAFYDWARTLGKPVDLFCPNAIPKKLQYLDHVYSFRHDPAILKEPHDVIVTFDTNTVDRASLTNIISKSPKNFQIISFDHHPTHTGFADLNIVFTTATSTCEVVYRFFEVNKILITSAMATSLLAGLVFDTTFFTNSATTADGMGIAGKLLAAGARFSDVTKNHAKNKTIPSLRLWGLALARLQKNDKYDLASTYFLKEDLTGVPEADEAIAGMSNFLAGVCGATDAILVLVEHADGTVRGSMRSLTRDVSKIAKLLGGGGHKKASGFSIAGKIKIENGKPRIVPV